MSKHALVVVALAMLAMSMTGASASSAQSEGSKAHQQLRAHRAAAAELGRTSEDRTLSSLAAACWNDPVGTTDPRADIREYCADYSAASLRLDVRVVQPTNPLTDRNWDDWESGVLWALDTTRGGGEDYFVFFAREGNAITVTVTDEDGVERCTGTGQFTDNRYRAVVNSSCIGSPARFDFDAFMVYETEDDIFADLTEPQRVTHPNPPPPGPLPGTRLAGPGRIDTAVEISKYEFPDGAEEVYLARADNFPDALAGGVLTRGPVLLVPQCGTLPTAVRDEIRRLDPVRIVALGGQAAVCDAIFTAARNANA